MVSTGPPLRVLTISTSDVAGGAEMMARSLHQAYSRAGVNAVMAVGSRRGTDPSVIDLRSLEPFSPWRLLADTVEAVALPAAGKIPGAGAIVRTARRWRHPQRARDQRAGIESWDFPASHALLKLAAEPGTVVHAHNLHGDWFDLRLLEQLRGIAPVVLSLHDAWLLSGHCAHSFDCQRWRTGCGECPDLTIYPSVERDATAENWRRKREIFLASRLNVATPNHWLMDRVDESMLRPGLQSAKLIPYGIDLETFTPGDRGAARRELGIPAGADLLLASAHQMRFNMWKDPALLRSAVSRVAAALPRREIICVALGGAAEEERVGDARFLSVFESDHRRLALWYRAADIFVHPSRMDTQPLVVLEALACGTPVVATAVGGIPELLAGAGDPASLDAIGDGAEAPSGGVLTPPGDAESMSRALVTLLERPLLRAAMSRAGLADARKRFDLTVCAAAYIAWFEQIQERRNSQL